MATTFRPEKIKAGRFEKTGNATVAIYRRDKFHTATARCIRCLKLPITRPARVAGKFSLTPPSNLRVVFAPG